MVLFVPLILAGAGLAMSVWGQMKAGSAAKKAGESMAQREEWNANIADLQSEDALDRGAEAESRFRSSVRSLIGRQRSGFAAQGVKVGTGSAADVQGDSAYLGELDAQQLRRNAQREAWGFRVEAHDRRLGADVARRGGNAAQTAARIGAAGTALTGASIMLERYGWGGKGSGGN